MATTEPDTSTAGKRPRGMANLASTLTGRTDSLARRSTEEQLAPDPSQVSTLNLSSPPAWAPIAAPPAPDDEGSARTAHPAKEEPPPSTGATQRAAASAKRLRPAGPSPAPPRPLSGPEGRLEASGETVVKWTLELAPQLVMALNVWERDETKRLGERVFRERMIDQALDRLPEDLDGILSVVSGLPRALRRAPGQQFGTRVRSSVRDKLLALRPELRVAGIKDIRIRDIYSAAVYQYLVGLGITVEGNLQPPRNRESENAS